MGTAATMVHKQALSSRASSAKNCSTSRRARAMTRSFAVVLYLYSLFVAIALLWAPLLANGQAFPSNGQYFTKALAISDAPSPGSPQHAGSNLVIAVDLSGDGKIDQSVFIPGSGAPTRYDGLEIYLVSAQTGSNFTVSNGTELLTQESGSTVKHLNWLLPPCMSPGVYNLTYYEASHINNEAFFSITPLNIAVDNPNKNGDSSQCDSLSNALQDQPQVDSAPTVNPYLDPKSGLASSGLSGGGAPTITVGETGLPTQWTIEPSGSSVSDVTESITTATIVVVSTATLTETVTAGQTSVFTTIAVFTTTITAVMATSDITAGGFFPVNGAVSLSLRTSLGLSLFVCCMTLLAFAI